jgi:hypothetical protein
MITLEWSHIFAIISIAVSGYLTIIVFITKLSGKIALLDQCIITIKNQLSNYCNENESDHKNFYKNKDDLKEDMVSGFSRIENKISKIENTLSAILERLEMRRKNDL